MDTSEQYIKMLEKAGEIQLHWNPQVGDWALAKANTSCRSYYYSSSLFKGKWKYCEVTLSLDRCSPITDLNNIRGLDMTSHGMIGVDEPLATLAQGDTDGNGFCFLVTDLIYLPRQDQLQEILEFPVGSFCDNFWSALANIHKWAFDKKWLDYIPLTMEQLWLAFVMKEKYNKVWDGKDWVKA